MNRLTYPEARLVGARFREVMGPNADLEMFGTAHKDRIYYQNDDGYLIESPEEWRRIQLLLSPHYKAILKAWAINKYGENWDKK